MLPELKGLVGVTCSGRWIWAVRMTVDAFLPLFEPQPINRSGPGLIHDPSDNGSVGSIVRRRSSPHVVKNVQCHFFGGFPIVGDSYGQCKHDSMHPFIQRMQSTLIARRDGLDEPHPVLLEYKSLRLVGIKHIAEGSTRIPILFCTFYRTHGWPFCSL